MKLALIPSLALLATASQALAEVVVVVRTQAWTSSYDLAGGGGGYALEDYFLYDNGKAALCALDEAELREHPTPSDDPSCWADWRQDGNIIELILEDGETLRLESDAIIHDRR